MSKQSPKKDAPPTRRTALAAMRGRLDDLPAEEVRPPTIPVDNLVAEALALSVTATSVRDDLVAKGLPPEQIDNLPTYAHGLAEAQAELNAIRGLKRSEAEINLEAQGVELRAEMIADGRFALRKNRDAQAALDRVQEGTGLDDLVQDLKDLAAFHGRFASDLETIGAEPKVKAERARKVAGELEGYVARRRGADGEEVGALDTRDRAASLLIETMAEVRAAGAYAFRKNPRVLVKFRSAYNARRGRGSKQPDAPVPPVPPAPPGPDTSGV